MANEHSEFQGRWLIKEMEMWDEDAMNMEVPAFVEFMDDRRGRFQFCLVQGFTDCRFETKFGQPFVEFSCDGFDENDPMSGRGWAKIEEDGTLEGRIFIHNGDESAFTAKKT